MFLSRIKGGLLKYHRGAFFFFPECSGSTGNKLGWDNYGLFRRHTCQSGGEKRWMCSRGLTCTAVDFGRLPDWLHTSHSAFQLLERDPSDILHSQEPAAMMEIQGCISREITAANSPVSSSPGACAGGNAHHQRSEGKPFSCSIFKSSEWGFEVI